MCFNSDLLIIGNYLHISTSIMRCLSDTLLSWPVPHDTMSQGAVRWKTLKVLEPWYQIVFVREACLASLIIFHSTQRAGFGTCNRVGRCKRLYTLIPTTAALALWKCCTGNQRTWLNRRTCRVRICSKNQASVPFGSTVDPFCLQKTNSRADPLNILFSHAFQSQPFQFYPSHLIFTNRYLKRKGLWHFLYFIF